MTATTTKTRDAPVDLDACQTKNLWRRYKTLYLPAFLFCGSFSS
jgi:hypothetical protein